MSALLVRHPAPHSKESLLGYVLRLSEVNGYQTPWGLFSLAGMKIHEHRTPGLKVEKLAAITGRSPESLTSITYSDPEQPRGCRLLGHNLTSSRELDLRHPKLCPICVKEKGFIEAHWDLSVMWVCPIHKARCLHECPKCNEPLSWYRPGLLECRCGADLVGQERLATVSQSAIADRTMDLLSIIRAKALHEENEVVSSSGLPLRDLLSLELRALLTIVRVLGQMSIDRRERPKAAEYEQIVERAAELLSNWPTNMKKFLSERAGLANTSFTRGAFGGLYLSLFRSDVLKKEDVGFIRATFNEFSQETWGRQIGNLVVRNDSTVFNKSRLAKHLGVDASTVRRMIERGEILTKQVSKNAFTVCDLSAPVKPSRILRIGEAAKEIGIPVNLLRILKRDGDFECHRRPGTKAGFHESDVAFFNSRITVKDVIDTPREGQLSLRRILQMLQPDQTLQVKLLRAALLQKVPLSGWTAANFGSLLMSVEAVESFVERELAKQHGMTVDCKGVEQALQCPRAAVRPLREAGLLNGIKTPLGFRYTQDSINQFDAEYQSLPSVASEQSTSCALLMRVCNATGIATLRFGSGRVPHFIRKADVGKLIAELRSRRSRGAIMRKGRDGRR